MTDGDDYPGGWFGASWGAPACDESRHLPTPVGQACLACPRRIGADDQGLAVPGPRAGLSHFHLDCFLRDIGVLDPLCEEGAEDG